MDRGDARLLHAGRRQRARRVRARRRRRSGPGRGCRLGYGPVPLAPRGGRAPGRRAGPAEPHRPRPLARAQDGRRRRPLHHGRPRERGARGEARTAAGPGSAGQACDARALRRRRKPRALHLDAAGAGRRHGGPRRDVPGARALLHPQGLALGRAPGVLHRPALGALVVHARRRGLPDRAVHVHGARSARRRHAGDPRCGRRRVRPPHHLDDALVRSPARPHRPALPGRRSSPRSR